MPPVQHIVHVTFNGAGVPLTLDLPTVEIAAGDSVRWDFLGLDVGDLAFIRFAAPAGRFGPFQTMEPSSFHVFGWGNNGGPGTYGYTALVMNATELRASSEEGASIVNQSDVEDASPVATVTFDPATNRIATQPIILTAQPGRSALWSVVGLPQDLFITFEFPDFTDTLVGPFSSVESVPGADGSPLVIGSSFSPPDLTTPIPYRIRVRDSAGNLVGPGEDPVIDPLGWPPG